MDIKIDSGEGSERQESSGESGFHLRKSVSVYFMIMIIIMSRILLSMNVKGASCQVLDGDEKHYWKLEERQSLL